MALDISQIQLPPAGIVLRLPPAARRRPGYPEICQIIEAHTSSSSSLRGWHRNQRAVSVPHCEVAHSMNRLATSQVE
jgi:hypothetical protein